MARMIADFGTVMAIGADDGLAFDVDALTARPIREEAEYGGMRLSTTAYLERTRIPVTINLGLGDALADPATPIPFSPLIAFLDHISKDPPSRTWCKTT